MEAVEAAVLRLSCLQQPTTSAWKCPQELQSWQQSLPYARTVWMVCRPVVKTATQLCKPGNILQALTAFYSKMDAAAGAADATAADGSWLSALQDAVAMLLAALLVVTPNADHVAHSSKSELMLQLFAVQKQLPTAQGNVQQLMGRFMERLAAHCTAV